jgi:uncharacterized protein (TIGR03083 family)
MDDDTRAGDPLEELSFALAEGAAEPVTDEVRARVVETALAARQPGRPVRSPEEISGLEAFRRTVSQMETLLAALSGHEWQRPALRDLTVQELIGHLIGADEWFLRGLLGVAKPPGADQHISSTQDVAKAQNGRPPALTLADWRDRTAHTVAACTERAPDVNANYYGAILPLDLVLVVRSFEIWVHHEDVRRAIGQPLEPPGDAVLARMVHLATDLLPIALARAGRSRQQASVRLVLTGMGGGSWDIPLGQPARGTSQPPASSTVVVVDAPGFCRVVGNREDLGGSGAVVLGDLDLAEDLFAGAASLALD